MKCNTCKEEIGEKFKFAISNNVCPVCGGGLFSKSDFFFRKSMQNVFIKNGIKDIGIITKIINEISELIDSPSENIQSSEGVGISGEAIINKKREIAEKEISDNIETTSSVAEEEEVVLSEEEKAEVDNMIENGEIVFSNPVIKNTKPMPRIKPIPKPVNRL